MKKEKSKVIFSIITVLVTISLIVVSIFQEQGDSCNEELTTLQYKTLKADIESAFFFDFYSNVNDRQDFDSLLVLRSLERNSSLNKSETAERFNDRSKMMSEALGLSTIKIGEADSLEEELEDKRVICNNWSLASKIALYFGLVLSLISMYYGNKIRQLYKT